MTTRLYAFFQHMPPYSGAAALRGRSIIGALVDQSVFDHVRVLTSTPDPEQMRKAEIDTLKIDEVENAQGLLRRMSGEVRMGWVAAREMFRVNPRPTMVLVSSPAYLTALLISAFARWHKTPYVLELRDIYPQVYAEAGLLRRESLLFRLFRGWSRRMYRGASLVLVATQGLAREVAIDAGNSRVVCVYNGFPRDLLERRPAPKHERFTVCFHGVLGFFQDIETLIGLARALEEHDIDVLAIGYGRKEHLLANAGLPNLRFLGRQSFANTIAEIERCHLGLCLRLDDGISKDAFPVKVWEYLGLGIPSFVTPACEAGDFLERNDCGRQFNAGDIASLLSAILELRNDSAMLETLSRRCRDVAGSYTREQTGKVAANLIAETFRMRGQPAETQRVS